MSKDCIGLWVWCFQKFKDLGMTDTPYMLEIIGESGGYWILDDPLGDPIRAHKAACSAKPFRKEDSRL